MSGHNNLFVEPLLSKKGEAGNRRNIPAGGTTRPSGEGPSTATTEHTPSASARTAAEIHSAPRRKAPFIVISSMNQHEGAGLRKGNQLSGAISPWNERTKRVSLAILSPAALQGAAADPGAAAANAKGPHLLKATTSTDFPHEKSPSKALVRKISHAERYHVHTESSTQRRRAAASPQRHSPAALLPPLPPLKELLGSNVGRSSSQVTTLPFQDALDEWGRQVAAPADRSTSPSHAPSCPGQESSTASSADVEKVKQSVYRAYSANSALQQMSRRKMIVDNDRYDQLRSRLLIYAEERLDRHAFAQQADALRVSHQLALVRELLAVASASHESANAPPQSPSLDTGEKDQNRDTPHLSRSSWGIQDAEDSESETGVREYRQSELTDDSAELHRCEKTLYDIVLNEIATRLPPAEASLLSSVHALYESLMLEMPIVLAAQVESMRARMRKSERERQIALERLEAAESQLVAHEKQLSLSLEQSETASAEAKAIHEEFTSLSFQLKEATFNGTLLQDEVDALAKLKELYRRVTGDHEATIARLQHERVALRGKMEAAIQGKILADRIIAQQAAALEEYKGAKRTIEEARARERDMANQLRAAEQRAQHVESARDRIESERSRLDAELHTESTERQRLQTIVEKQDVRLDQLISSVEVLKEEQDRLVGEISALEEERTQLAEERDLARTELASVQEDLADAQDHCRQLEEAKDSAQRLQRTAESEAEAARSEVERMTAQLREARNANGSLVEAAEEARASAERARSALEALEREVNAQDEEALRAATLAPGERGQSVVMFVPILGGEGSGRRAFRYFHSEVVKSRLALREVRADLAAHMERMRSDITQSLAHMGALAEKVHRSRKKFHVPKRVRNALDAMKAREEAMKQMWEKRRAGSSQPASAASPPHERDEDRPMLQIQSSIVSSPSAQSIETSVGARAASQHDGLQRPAHREPGRGNQNSPSETRRHGEDRSDSQAPTSSPKENTVSLPAVRASNPPVPPRFGLRSTLKAVSSVRAHGTSRRKHIHTTTLPDNL